MSMAVLRSNKMTIKEYPLYLVKRKHFVATVRAVLAEAEPLVSKTGKIIMALKFN